MVSTVSSGPSSCCLLLRLHWRSPQGDFHPLRKGTYPVIGLLVSALAVLLVQMGEPTYQAFSSSWRIGSSGVGSPGSTPFQSRHFPCQAPALQKIYQTENITYRKLCHTKTVWQNTYHTEISVSAIQKTQQVVICWGPALLFGCQDTFAPPSARDGAKLCKFT